jgi:hypothetical protein
MKPHKVGSRNGTSLAFRGDSMRAPLLGVQKDMLSKALECASVSIWAPAFGEHGGMLFS